MSEAIAVFVVQLLYVFLLGMQSRNVNNNQMWAAMTTSAILGVFGLFMASVIARAAVAGGDYRVYAAYVISGPCGIALAMYTHNRMWNAKKPRR